MNPWTPVRIRPAQTGSGRVHYIGRTEPAARLPWNLTAGQMAVLGALVEMGSPRAVARKLGKSIRTVEEQLYRARKKMGAQSNAQAAVMWDRRAR